MFARFPCLPTVSFFFLGGRDSAVFRSIHFSTLSQTHISTTRKTTYADKPSTFGVLPSTSKLPCFHQPSRSCTLDRFASHQRARNPHDRLTSVKRRRLDTRDGACACARKAKEKNIGRRLTKHTGPRAGKTEVVCAATAEETAAEAGHGLRLSALQPRQVRHVQNQPRTRRGKARMFHLRCHVRLRRKLVECTHRCIQRMDRRTGIRERSKTPDVPAESKGAPEIPCPGSKHRKEDTREEPELLCLGCCLHEVRST